MEKKKNFIINCVYYMIIGIILECAVWMYRTDYIADMKKDFMETLSVSEQVTQKGTKLKPWL